MRSPLFSEGKNVRGGGGERERVTEIKRMRDRKDAANSTGGSAVVQSYRVGSTPFHKVFVMNTMKK